MANPKDALNNPITLCVYILPSADLYILIGSDNIFYFETWWQDMETLKFSSLPRFVCLFVYTATPLRHDCHFLKSKARHHQLHGIIHNNIHISLSQELIIAN